MCNCLSPRGKKDQTNSTKWRIHSSYGPVSNNYCQEQEGEQRVKHGTHHVSNGSGKEEENSRLAWSRFCCRGLPRFQKAPKCSRHAVPMAVFSPINADVSCLQRFPVMVWKLNDQDIKNMWCTRHHVFQSTLMKSYLLASLMRAMAMRILFRKKMSSRMMMTSMMARIITKTSQRVWAHWN